MSHSLFVSIIIITFVLQLAITSNSYAEFIVNGNSTVTDSKNLIMWEDEPYKDSFWQPQSRLTPKYAKYFCPQQLTGNYLNWHLPDIRLLDYLYENRQLFPTKLKGKILATDGIYDFDSGEITKIDIMDLTEKNNNTDVEETTSLIKAAGDFVIGKSKNEVENKGYMKLPDVKAICYRLPYILPDKCTPYDVDYSTSGGYVFFKNNDEYKKMHCHPLIISAWRRNGFQPDELTEWLGFTENEATSDISIGPVEARRWVTNGFSPSEVTSCRKNGFFKKEAEATAWKTAKVSCEDAKIFLNKNISVDNVAKWTYLTSNVKDIIAWIDAGFTVDQAKPWIQVGITAEESTKWIRRNFLPLSAHEWRKFADADNATKWRESGFEASEALEWNKYKFSIERAVRWKTDGKSPSEAAKWASYTPEEARTYQRNLQRFCPKGSKGVFDLIQTNPYETNGICYLVSCSQVQLLSRSHGLYKCYPDQIVYIDFGNEAAPITYGDLAAGQGAYSYTTTFGSTKIVPMLKKISTK